MHDITARAAGKRKLTEKQEKFLDAFVLSKGKKSLKECAIEAGYEPTSPGSYYSAVRGLKNEIQEATELMLVEAAPKAANSLIDILDSEEKILNINQKLDAAKTILDRIGVGKQERVQVDANITGGVFILPAKASEVIEDAEYTEES